MTGAELPAVPGSGLPAEPPTGPTTTFVRDPAATRRRAWVWTGCAAVLVLVYLAWWTVYSTTHLSSYQGYTVSPPGTTATQFHADFRLLGLARSDELSSSDGDPQSPVAGAVWLVATVEVVRRAEDSDFLCSTELLGPGGRLWEPSPPSVSRTLPEFCDTDGLAVGRTYQFEQVYEVPLRYADDVRGVVLVDHLDGGRQQVLTATG